MRGRPLTLLAALALLGCSKERDRPAAEPCPSWQGGVDAIVASRCATSGCHGGPAPAGQYDLTSYLGVLGGGTDDTANAVAGDAASTLLAVLAPSDATHAGVADARAQLATWVVECRLAYEDNPIHAAGLMNPADDDFHGREIARRNWDFPLCQSCHGQDFAGGSSGASCLTCHTGEGGPVSCGTCHDEAPRDGAHPAHLVAGVLGKTFACSECHTVPAAWNTPGHILLADGTADPAPAEVTMTGLATDDLDPPRRTGPPAYDPAARRCDNVYCHGGVFADGSAAHPAPVWEPGTGQAACGACHGGPPSDHGSTDPCVVCHARVARADGTLDLARHLDGNLDVGDGAAGGTPCTGCHGQGDDPAPPRDLSGNTVPMALGVGAHQSHLTASLQLRGPIPCSDCHVVPATILSPGHIDSPSPAEVFPPGLGGTAFANGSMPVWDRASATCAGTWCHLDYTPTWTAVGRGEAGCTTCHGIPPQTGGHTPTMTVFDCSGCHTTTVDDFGNILRSGPPGAETSEHIDGTLDF
jgi:predicted CxxxxCH...CXXCH cytochrome family protein